MVQTSTYTHSREFSSIFRPSFRSHRAHDDSRVTKSVPYRRKTGHDFEAMQKAYQCLELRMNTGMMTLSVCLLARKNVKTTIVKDRMQTRISRIPIPKRHSEFIYLLEVLKRETNKA